MEHTSSAMMTSNESTNTLEAADLAADLIRLTNPLIQSQPEPNRIAISQTQHRLNLLRTWFGSLDAAKQVLEGKTVLEIGCGQGDMTVALAWAVGPSGTVNAVDPAPSDYGSPETLQEAQGRISRSSLGTRTNWVRCEPVEALQQSSKLCEAHYIVLAHSLLYMESKEYVAALFRALNSRHTESPPTLLVAEWGMRVSNERAKAHLYAVQAQAAQPLLTGNVQLYVEPKMTVELAVSADWKMEMEAWIESPELDDGVWEVAAARSMAVVDDADHTTKTLIEGMNRVVMTGQTRCMDVWTGMFY
jgi:hypothetical protein